MLSGSFFADGRRSLDRGLEALLVHRMGGSCDPKVAPLGEYVRSGEAVELEALDARRTTKGAEIAIANLGSRPASCGDGAPLHGLPVDRRNKYFRTVPVFEARGPLWPAQEEPLHRHRSALANKVHAFFRWSSSPAVARTLSNIVPMPVGRSQARGTRPRPLSPDDRASQRTRVDFKKTASPGRNRNNSDCTDLENPA